MVLVDPIFLSLLINFTQVGSGLALGEPPAKSPKLEKKTSEVKPDSNVQPIVAATQKHTPIPAKVSPKLES